MYRNCRLAVRHIQERLSALRGFANAMSERESAGSPKAANEIRGVIEEIDLPLLWRGRAGEGFDSFGLRLGRARNEVVIDREGKILIGRPHHHQAAEFCALTAGFSTRFHHLVLAKQFAFPGAFQTNLSTRVPDWFLHIGIASHEVGSGLTDFRTILQQPNLLQVRICATL